MISVYSYKSPPTGGERMSVTAYSAEQAMRLLQRCYPFTLERAGMQVKSPSGWELALI